MRWPYRLMMIGFGLYVILYGFAQLERGKFAYENMKGQTVFAPGVMGVGAVLLLLGFLPPGNWLYKRITTKRRPIDTTYHSHRERSAAHRTGKDDHDPQNHAE
jgi:hypothetical protein